LIMWSILMLSDIFSEYLIESPLSQIVIKSSHLGFHSRRMERTNTEPVGSLEGLEKTKKKLRTAVEVLEGLVFSDLLTYKSDSPYNAVEKDM